MTNTTDTAIYCGPHRDKATAAPVEYRPPIEQICPSCGAKHTGFFHTCASCANKE